MSSIGPCMEHFTTNLASCLLTEPTSLSPSDVEETFQDQQHEPLAFHSGSFKVSGARWSSPEKEAFAIVESTTHLDYILFRRKEPDKVPEIEDLVKGCRVSLQNVYALTLRNTTVQQFEGACLDTGAYRTVVGLSQMRLYEKKYGVTLKPWREPANFIFGDHVSPSLGVVFLIITTPHGPVQVKTHVVKPNIPFLIGLDVLDSLGWNVLSV